MDLARPESVLEAIMLLFSAEATQSKPLIDMQNKNLALLIAIKILSHRSWPEGYNKEKKL